MRILILVAIALAIALPSLAVDKIPEMTSVEGKHIIFKARVEDMKLLKDPKTWVANLDKMYEGYADLVGGTPFGGEKTTILVVEEFPGGWAVAGNPITWYRDCFLESIEDINRGDWSFGIMHEIGHNFDLDYRWVWNAELFANLKMNYALEYAKGNVFFGDKFCDYSDPHGSRAPANYRSIAEARGMAERMTDGGQEGDSEHEKYIRIIDDIGWEPFKKMFRWYSALGPDELSDDGLLKRSLFIRALEEQSGVKLADRLINWGISFVSADAKDAKAAARLFHDKNWHADVVQYLINTTPGEKVIVSVNVAERNPINFKKGLATLAESEIIYDLGGKYKTFESFIGVPGRDDAENRWGTGVFKVVADGKNIYESPLMSGGGTYNHLAVNIDGAKELKLIVENDCHAAWADAKVTDAAGNVTYLSDLKPVSVKMRDDYKLGLDKDMGNKPLTFYYGPSVQPVKITGMVDGKIIELRPSRVAPETYEYVFENGFDLGTHLVWLEIKVGDKLTQHDLVTIVVK